MGNLMDYFTPEQQEKMTKQMDLFTPEEIKRLRKESNAMIDQLRVAMEKNTPTDDSNVLHLAKRLKESANAFIEPDPEVDKAIERFHIENPEQLQHGMNLKLYRYIEEAKANV